LVNEHLPQIAGQALVSDVLRRGNRFYTPPPREAFMPIEFGAACYRFGHSMVRPSYRANFSSGTGDSTSADRTAARRFAELSEQQSEVQALPGDGPPTRTKP
jgi:hypothetical protein